MTEMLVRDQFIKKMVQLLSELNILEQKLDVKTPLGRVDLVFKARIGNVEKTFVCEFKSSGEPKYVHQGVSQVKLLSSTIKSSYPLLVVPHLGENGKDICRLSKVGYVDLYGNYFIKFDNVFIHRATDSRELSASFRIRKPKKRLLSGLFAPFSSRIIRILLLDPDKSWSLKELSKAENISLGYVHKVAKNLEEHGYAIRDENYRLKVNRPGSLLDFWATSYNFIQVNTLHAFYTFERDVEAFTKKFVSISEEKQLKYALTLHAGASKVAPYTRFTDVHCYINPKDLSLWRSSLDLKPVEAGGTVYLVEPYDKGVFKGLQLVDDVEVVSNVQLYVDLYNYPARGREQAEFLREKRIMFR